MLSACEDTPNLARHTYPSAALFNAIRENLVILNRITRIGPQAFCGGFGHPQEYTGSAPYREAWGSFRMVPGATTLTTVLHVGPLAGAAAGPGPNDRMRLSINGADVATWALTSGVNTYAVTLPTLAAWTVAEVVWEAYDTTGPSGEKVWPNIEIEDAYISPINAPSAWPGVPTFSTSPTAAGLAQLADAVDWLIAYAGRRTEPLFQTAWRTWGTLFLGQLPIRWHGGLTAPSNARTLRAEGEIWPGYTNAAPERIRMLVNGAEVASYAVPTAGPPQTWSLSATIAAATHAGVVVEYTRDGNPPSGIESGLVNGWSLHRVWCEASATAPIAMPPLLSPRTAITWTTLVNALNDAATAAINLKSRMDNAAMVWGRQRLFRRRYAYDDYQTVEFEPRMTAYRAGRQGEALVVRGNSCTIQYGPVRWLNQQNETGAELWEQLRQQSMLSGRDVTTELLYLSTIDGLPGGAPYHVRGVDLAYAGEIWRVGSDL